MDPDSRKAEKASATLMVSQRYENEKIEGMVALMSNATFAAVSHLVWWATFGNPFVSEVSAIGILSFREFFDDALFFFGGIFYSLIEFVARVVFIASAFGFR